MSIVVDCAECRDLGHGYLDKNGRYKPKEGYFPYFQNL